MNYEHLYEELTEVKKNITSAVSDIKKKTAVILKVTDSGDLKLIDKTLNELQKAMDNNQAAMQIFKEKLDQFDRSAYISDGSFKLQIIEECKKQNIDVKDGDGNVLEMFPNKVTINPETQDVTIDKKKVSCLRPSELVKQVKQIQEKIGKAAFNDERFLEELYSAYESIIAVEAMKKNKKPVYRSTRLIDVYKKLAPTSRAKKDYDLLAFAYDVARLFSSETRMTKNGYVLTFDTARNIDKNTIRILDAYGNEYFLTTIQFSESTL